jgi:hypothetical protein
VTDPKLTASGGWCAPGEAYQTIDVSDIPTFFPEAAVLRRGITFTAPSFTPPTAEERERWERERAEAREARKLAGGEWRYAIRVTDSDGDVEILDGSNPWDEGTVYLSAQEVIEDHRYEIEHARSWEVVCRWIADPPEWEIAVIETSPDGEG